MAECTGDRYKQFFDEADTDKDGNLTFEELTAALRSKGYQGSDLKIKASFIILQPVFHANTIDKEFQPRYN
jgi:Ca2+-binding EF-hand superfamily protein